MYKFNNFKLFKISKRNVSRARNFGIRKSKGKYIFFLDSDDLIFESTINDLVNYNRKKNFNLLISAHRQTTGSKRKKYDGLKKNCKFNKKNLIDYYKYFLKYPDIYTAFVHCWSRIYNRKILLKYNIAFNENLNNLEDVNFNLKFINHTKKIGYLNQVTYLHSTEKIHLRSSFDIKSNIIKMIKVTKLNLKKFFLKIDKKNLNKYSSLLNHYLIWNAISYVIRISNNFSSIIKNLLILKKIVYDVDIQNNLKHYIQFAQYDRIIYYGLKSKSLLFLLICCYMKYFKLSTK